MNRKLMKLAIMKVLKFRFMLWWRSAALVVLFIYNVFWLFSPVLLAMYLKDSFFSFLCILGVVSLFINMSALDDENFCLIRWFDTLLEDQKELKRLIENGKDAIGRLKKSTKESLEIYELIYLRGELDHIGIETTPVTNHINMLTEIQKLKDNMPDNMHISFRDGTGC